MTLNEALYLIADELRAVASLGLRYCENGYDKERYEQILHASARLVAAMENRLPEEVYGRYAENFTHISPLLVVEAAVFRDGKILLIRRSDDGLWAVPGGLAEVGETPAQGAVRELWEEAGVRGQVKQLLWVFDSRRWGSRAKMHLVCTLFLLESEDDPHLHGAGEGDVSPMRETLDVGFFAEDELPPLHPGHDQRVPIIFQLYRGEIAVPYFDA